jgi:glycosyltransferase involved in cell wall biosynthesis
MTSPRTVALFTSVAGWRGSATSYLKIARGMVGSGWHVHAIVGGDALVQPFVEAGATAESVLYPGTGVRAARDFARRLLGKQASVVIADTPRDMRVAVLARAFARVPVVYRYNLNYRQPHTGFAERLYLRATAGCVFQGRAIASEFLRAYPALAGHPRWLVPNGYERDDGDVESSRARAMRTRLGVAPGSTVVLCGAMLVASKGHDTLFAAMRRVIESGIDATLVVCGSGGAATDIEAVAGASGVPVIFTGLLTHEEMRAAYAMADVLVHPSEREIFPNVVAEGMACGTAVVAVDSWGTADVVGDAGMLVPPRDPVAMAAAIVAMISDDRMRTEYGARARRRIRERFPMARMVDGYRRVLEAVALGGDR